MEWTKTCGPIPGGLILTHTHFLPIAAIASLSEDHLQLGNQRLSESCAVGARAFAGARDPPATKAVALVLFSKTACPGILAILKGSLENQIRKRNTNKTCALCQPAIAVVQCWCFDKNPIVSL